MLHFLLCDSAFLLKFWCGCEPATAVGAQKCIAVSILALMLQHLRSSFKSMKVHQEMSGY
eukprot:5519353-Pleurochrysis_carterae.AAC.1